MQESDKKDHLARYLAIKCTANQRQSMLGNMRPALRAEMTGLIVDELAEHIAKLNDEVRALRLSKLRNENPAMYGGVMSRMAELKTAHLVH
jgi:hypothetical protein